MMNKSELTREQKRHLRVLAETAYEREMNNTLENLFSFFEKWKKGEIDAQTLDHEIHKHHNGISRELYNLYNFKDPRLPVAHAVKRGVIKLVEIREDCRSIIGVFLDLSNE